MGVAVLTRPPEFAGHTASVMDAIDHALNIEGGVWGYVVLLQPTSPLCAAEDIDGAVTLCHTRGAPSVIRVSTQAQACLLLRAGA